MDEIGTGNISAIKTKTDTIAWGDVTGLVTSSDQIKAKTDTINWADVTAVKTKTDTIAWDDVTGIKTKTDTINWTDVTTIKTEADKITSIKTTVDDTNTDLSTVQNSVDSVVTKWDTYTAKDIMDELDNVAVPSIGNPSDLSSTDTLFGKVALLKEKWGDYTASDLYTGGTGTGGGTTAIVPSTVSSEVSTAVINVYNQVKALRAEVRALGKTAPVYKILVKLQASLNRINMSLEKLETASTHPLYTQVLELSNQLKATGVVKGGGKVMSLYEVSAKQAEDIEYLKKKLEELKAVSELSKEIVAEKKKKSKKAVIKTNW